jgi:hypothetical protein
MTKSLRHWMLPGFSGYCAFSALPNYTTNSLIRRQMRNWQRLFISPLNGSAGDPALFYRYWIHWSRLDIHF